MIKVHRHTLEFIIPDRDRDGTAVDPHPVLEGLCKEIGDAGLGMSVRDQSGIWINEKGGTIREGNIVVCVSFQGHRWPEMIGVTTRFALMAANDLNQAEIALNVNGVLVTTSTGLDDGHEDVEACVPVPKPKNPLNGAAKSLNDDSFSREHIKG